MTNEEVVALFMRASAVLDDQRVPMLDRRIRVLENNQIVEYRGAHGNNRRSAGRIESEEEQECT
jgi:hypothetical protein